jgi:hypothetical protein
MLHRSPRMSQAGEAKLGIKTAVQPPIQISGEISVNDIPKRESVGPKLTVLSATPLVRTRLSAF